MRTDLPRTWSQGYLNVDRAPRPLRGVMVSIQRPIHRVSSAGSHGPWDLWSVTFNFRDLLGRALAACACSFRHVRSTSSQEVLSLSASNG
jgi:hypothetical protein